MFEFRTELQTGLEKLELTVDEVQLDRLCRFAELLSKWNKVYNLTAITSDVEILTHHLLDSASLVPFVHKIHPSAERVLDVGSGGGLPAIPLAILRPDLQITAVDAVSKKTAFLTQVAIELRLTNFIARHTRVEKLHGIYDLITSRAFASLADFVSLTQSLIAPSGAWLAMKGVMPDNEVSSLPLGVRVEQICPLSVPGLSEERHLVVIKPVP